MPSLSAVVLLLAEAATHAEHASDAHHVAGPWGAEQWGLPLVAWHAINIALVVFGAWYFGRKALPAFIAQRRATIVSEIEEARRLRDEVVAQVSEYERKLATIDAQMRALVDEAKAESMAERGRIVAEAEKAAARMKADAQAIATQEVEKARRLLVAEMLQLSAQAAIERIKGSVTSEDQERLSKEFLTATKGAAA